MTIALFPNIQNQKSEHISTTVANFLEIDIGSAATAMGGAYVSVANDVSSAYWNPAGLSFINKKQAYFMYQPWILDTDSFFCWCSI